VSYRIALAGEVHTVAETIIKPCAVEMATSVLSKQSKKTLQTVQLSNNTVKRRIQVLSADTEN
jgi:hypothetical protein